jgi:hypothetical protein
MAKASRRQFLVSVSGIDGYFGTKQGGNVTSAVNKVYDGGALHPDLIAGPPEAADITVSKPYDPARDDGVLASLRNQVGVFTATITVQPADRDMVASGTPTVYPNALLVGLTEPEADASAGNEARWDLVFAIGAFQ